jgi:DNA-directed RNA polymerase specialized sigma24 family protein
MRRTLNEILDDLRATDRIREEAKYRRLVRELSDHPPARLWEAAERNHQALAEAQQALVAAPPEERMKCWSAARPIVTVAHGLREAFQGV